MAEPANGRSILISPVTRIEGHAKITLEIGDGGEVTDAHFHVNEFRGFEKFCEGRLYTEMPSIAPRICGICPVSHAVASAKACEQIQRVEVPRAGDQLRRLMHLGQQISSHALSFFHLSSPDFLLGWDADPAIRNIAGLAQRFPDVAKRGIRLRKFGQELSERIAGKKIHAAGIVAGGTSCRLDGENRRALLDWIPEALETTAIALDLLRRYCDSDPAGVGAFSNFETAYLGTVGPEGEHEFYDGNLRWVDRDGALLADQVPPDRYLDFIAERSVPFSYLKYPYFKPLGYPDGIYRVGPLARLNVASRMKTPRAQREFEAFRAAGGGRPVHGDFEFHRARLIEVLAAIEQVEEILRDDAVLSADTRAFAGRNRAEGIGSSEAPRGTLFHHYWTNAGGALERVNLLIATGQNNPAMNRSVLGVARRFVRGTDVPEPALNRVEAAIRCYDPCLSCSTHALGAMPLEVRLVVGSGRVLHVVRRG